MAYSTNTGLHFCRDYKSRYRSDKVNGPIFFSSREHRHFFDFYPLLYLLLQTNDEIFRAARYANFSYLELYLRRLFQYIRSS